MNAPESTTNGTKKLDQRARLRPMPSAENYVYGMTTSENGQMIGKETNILYPLYEMGGLVWPYTPTINIQQNVDYSSYEPIHSNQEFKAYKRTQALTFSCSGVFTAQNLAEKEYSLAVLHFLRTVTKMHFGINDSDRGTPPPVLLFSAYGNLMFNDLPVVVNSYDMNLSNDVDYVRYERIVGINRQTGLAWIPAKFTVNVSMTVQKTPTEMRNNFDLNKFRTGELLLGKKGGWW